MELRSLLYSEDYDSIVFYENSKNNVEWTMVTSGFECTIDSNGERDYPLYRLSRVNFYNTTKKDVNEMITYLKELLLHGIERFEE